MEGYCFRHRIPFNLFDKWYRDTRHRIVPVTIEGAPEPQKAEEDQTLAATPSSPACDCAASGACEAPTRIMVDIRTTSGLHVHQRNLSYSALLTLVKKLEGIC